MKRFTSFTLLKEEVKKAGDVTDYHEKAYL